MHATGGFVFVAQISSLGNSATIFCVSRLTAITRWNSSSGYLGLQLSPQFFAYGSSFHEGSEHDCFAVASDEVVLAPLRDYMP